MRMRASSELHAACRTRSVCPLRSVAFQRALAAQVAAQGQVTAEMIKQAEWIAGVEYTEDERSLLLNGVNETLGHFDSLRRVEIDNGVPPALVFSSHPVMLNVIRL